MEVNFSIPQNGSEMVFYDYSTSRVLWIFLVVILSITFILGVLGNGLVIYVVGFRMIHSATTICYLNLALADFSYMASLPFQIISIVMNGEWLFGWFLCKFVHTIININLFQSIFLITFIAMDRCICVLHPVWAQNHRTVTLAKKVIVGAWILVLVLIFPHFIFVTTVRDEKGKVHCICNFESWAATPEEQVMVSMAVSLISIIVTFILGFSIPMIFIVICYGLMAAKIGRRGFVTSSHPLRVLTAVAFSFFLCWFPFQLIYLLGYIGNKETLNYIHMWVNPANTLASFNSCLNPILYVFLGQQFRKRLIYSLSASLERALREDSALNSDKVRNMSSHMEDFEA